MSSTQDATLIHVREAVSSHPVPPNVHHAIFVVLSYQRGDIGVGRVLPLCRFEQAFQAANADERPAIVYQHTSDFPISGPVFGVRKDCSVGVEYALRNTDLGSPIRYAYLRVPNGRAAPAEDLFIQELTLRLDQLVLPVEPAGTEVLAVTTPYEVPIEP